MTTRTLAVSARRSAAATVRAAGAPPGPPMLPYPGPAGPSLPAGTTTSVSSRSRALDRSRERPVVEGRERLGNPDDRDPRGVERAPVGVRIDRALEAGEQLVGPAVDREAAVGVGLPARDADRQDGRARGHAVGSRPARRGRRAGPRSASRAARRASARRDAAARARGRRDRARRCRPRPGRGGTECVASTPVSSRAIVMPRAVETGHAARARRPRRARTSLGSARERERGRIRGTHGIDADDVRLALEQGERARVDRRREAVERARVDEVGDRAGSPRARASPRSASVRRATAAVQCAHLGLARLAARLGDPVGERRVLEDDDHALADGDVAPLAVDEAAPGRRAGGGRIARGAVPAAGEEQRAAYRQREAAGEPRTVRRAMHMHRGQGSEDREGVCRICPRRRSSRRCRCRARAARSGRAAAPRAARSWPRRRPRRRSSRGLPARQPPAVRSTSARTIARWYEAARSARRATASSPRSRTA